ncbi:MAG TPA: CBS domain-containing protein [Kofleriaceae bacterium]|nr:CBS domain-containing protein [Kofleriaceae bacterium]
MRAPPPPSLATEVHHEDDATEVESYFGRWLAATADDGDFDFDRELDDDARRRRGDGSRFGAPARLATGTGQFDLRGDPRELADEPLVDAAATPLSLVMARKVVCVRGDLDASEARARMLARGVNGLPVVDDWGRAIGVVSKSDLVEHEVTSRRCGRRVVDVMTPLVFSLREDASIGQAAALMAYEGIHRVVVVDRGGYVVGLVSSLDVARWLGSRAGHPVGQEV